MPIYQNLIEPQIATYTDAGQPDTIAAMEALRNAAPEIQKYGGSVQGSGYGNTYNDINAYRAAMNEKYYQPQASNYESYYKSMVGQVEDYNNKLAQHNDIVRQTTSDIRPWDASSGTAFGVISTPEKPMALPEYSPSKNIMRPDDLQANPGIQASYSTHGTANPTPRGPRDPNDKMIATATRHIRGKITRPNGTTYDGWLADTQKDDYNSSTPIDKSGLRKDAFSNDIDVLMNTRDAIRATADSYASYTTAPLRENMIAGANAALKDYYIQQYSGDADRDNTINKIFGDSSQAPRIQITNMFDPSKPQARRIMDGLTQYYNKNATELQRNFGFKPANNQEKQGAKNFIIDFLYDNLFAETFSQRR